MCPSYNHIDNVLFLGGLGRRRSVRAVPVSNLSRKVLVDKSLTYQSLKEVFERETVLRSVPMGSMIFAVLGGVSVPRGCPKWLRCLEERLVSYLS